MLKKSFFNLSVIVILVVTLSVGIVWSDVGKKAPRSLSKPATWDERRIEVGRLWIPITNYGKHGQDKWGNRGEWPGGSADEYIFGAGIWVGAKVNGMPAVTVGYDPSYGFVEFTPGNVPNNWPAQSGTVEDDAERIYFSTDTDIPWPIDQSLLPNNAPPAPTKIVSDVDTWCWFNDLASGQHKVDFKEAVPLGIMVIQTTYAWAAKGFEDIVFFIFDVVNIREDKATLKDVYVAPGVDPDIWTATDDMVGFDLSRNMAYVYDIDNQEPGFVRVPGMLGYDFLESPLATRDIDSNGDGVINDDSVMVKYHGMAGSIDTLFIKDVRKGEPLGLTAFKKFTIQIDPGKDWKRYAMMAGYDYRRCSYDVETGQLTTQPEAWSAYDEDEAPEDKRFLLSTGPFDLSFGDTARVALAIMVNGVDDISELEADPLANLKKLQQTSDLAQTIYEAGYVAPKAPDYPSLTVVPGDQKATLIWDDRAETSADPYYPIASEFDPDYVEYDFEGYRIYRSPTAVAGSWELLAEFDKPGNAKERLISNEAIGEAHFVHIGDNTGLVHTYTDSGLINGLTYYYTVTSYDFQPVSTPVTLESGKSNITVVKPTRPPAGTIFGSVAAVEHASGTSDATVEVFLANHQELTGHDYKVTFSVADTLGNLGWNLIDVNTKQKLVETNTSFNVADSPAPITGTGFAVKVNNPPAGMKGFEIPSGKRWLTWEGGAGAWGFEGFHGAITWGGNFFSGSTLTGSDVHHVLFKFAATDENGNLLNPNDRNSCMAYRYLANPGAPARPEFAEYITNLGFGIVYQDRRRLPLIAIDEETGKQLAVGFLENNKEGGSVDGKYWPPNYADASNTDLNGPLEWLFVFANEYSEADDPEIAVNLYFRRTPLMWWLLVARRGAVHPEAGDQFRILANHIATTEDVFTFSTVATTAMPQKEDLDNIKVVPNPFIVTNQWSPSADYGVIYFTNLPEKCIIRIFTMAGDFIQMLEKDDDSGQKKWDITTYNHQDIASGVYFAHIDAPGVGEKILKFAIVK